MREEEYSSKDRDHLGIVSAMCDEIDLVNTIDHLIPPDPRALLTTGECIKLVVINGLGICLSSTLSKSTILRRQAYSTSSWKTMRISRGFR